MRKTLFQKRIRMKGMLGVLACVIFFCLNSFVSEAAEGKVTADTAKIRKEASTDSEVIGSTSQGKTVDILGAVKDSSGTVWYKVSNGNNTYGYIRSDLIETSGTIEVTETQSSSSSSSENTNKPAETVPTSIGEQQATVSQSSVRIRSGASTQHDAVGSLTQGTVITLIGEANDSAGNKWYQMTCNQNGRNLEGYIRSDLITIGAPAEENNESEVQENESGEGTEGENTEATPEEPAASEEPEAPEHNDFEIVYNEDQYWLYNNIDSTMMRVEDLLNVVNTANDNNEKMQNQINNNKIIIVILAVIIVILVVAVTILIFKLRNLYYEDYEEEEEEEEEPVPVRRKRSSTQEISSERRERPARPGQSQSADLQAAERKQPVKRPEVAPEKAPEKKPAPRKTQNFLLDDDEFEFEFLNMDDKDL